MRRGWTGIVRGLRLGLAYFAIVFAAGFVLGVLRVLLIAPRVGETMGVLLELPVILTLAWLVSQRLTRKLPDGFVERAVMGASALALLLLAEFGLAMLAPGARPMDLVQRWSSAPGALGLLGQFLFAFLPVIGETPRRVDAH